MRNPKHLVCGIVGSAALFTIFLIIQSRYGSPLDVPKTFLIVCLAPVVIGLVSGGYLKSIKVLGIAAEMQNLPEAPQPPPSTPPKPIADNWTRTREGEYTRTNHYMLAHAYRPSSLGPKWFDVFIFVVRHEKGSPDPPKNHFAEIEKAEFFFGESWGNEVFTSPNTGGIVGVRTHAWGTFLATCRLTFRGSTHEPIILHRYIDYAMAQSNAEQHSAGAEQK